MNTQRNFEDPRITTYGHFVEAFAMLTKKLDDEMEMALNLPLLWYGVLLHLGRSPGGYCPISELVEATALTSGGVTRLVDRIEQAGYVERRPCPNDRRVTYVGLTTSGWDMLERASAVHVRGIQEQLVDALSPEELAQFDATLTTLIEARRPARQME